MDTREQVIEKLTKLRDTKFGGDTQRMFDHYAHDNLLSRGELTLVLIDAEVGSRLTRGLYIIGIMNVVDKNEDDSISFDELNTVINSIK